MNNSLNINNIITKILDDFNITKPYVDVYKIATESGINVMFEGLAGDASGILIIKNGKATIAINSKHHENRQRFTIAHELGHYFLHSEKNGDDLFIDERIFYRNSEASSGTKLQEIEANKFAARLLMPKNMLQAYIDKKDFDLSNELDFYLLAEKFSVSEQAMGFRLGKLGLYN